MTRRPPNPPLFPTTPLSRSDSHPSPPVQPPARVLDPDPDAEPSGAAAVRRSRPASSATRSMGESFFSAAARRSRSSTLSDARSEEHTSELQSQSNLVCRLLL